MSRRSYISVSFLFSDFQSDLRGLTPFRDSKEFGLGEAIRPKRTNHLVFTVLLDASQHFRSVESYVPLVSLPR